MHEKCDQEKGYVLIIALIILTITAALVLGFVTQVNIQQKIGLNDLDYTGAFYAAEGGLEKLNSDLSKLFQEHVFPSTSQITTIQGGSYRPVLSGMNYSTYSLTGGQQTVLTAAMTIGQTTAAVQDTTGWPATGFFMIGGESLSYTGLTATSFTGLGRGSDSSNPATHPVTATVSHSQVITIAEGPSAGLNAQVIPFTLLVVARSVSGAESKLSRDVQVALIPVFQFGVFSDSDLSFFAGPNFNFGGRVHTNGNLYLAQNTGATLTLSQKVTATQNVIRTVLTNGWNTSSSYDGIVSVTKNPGVFRPLARTEGSLSGGPGSVVNSGWKTLSLTTYNGNILNGATGAKPLTLPFAGGGVSPVEIIKRPVAGDDLILTDARLYTQASLRILLSDSKDNLPGGVGYLLRSPLAGYTVNASHPPFAVADPSDPDYVTATNADETASTALIDGYIRIDMQKADRTWADVTLQILDLGISTGNDITAVPNPNAILRFQRLKPSKASGSTASTDYMPLSLFDAREGRFRDSIGLGIPKVGIMGLVELDVSNLKRWFAGSIGNSPVSGNLALADNGYILYFSDRRGNRNAAGHETGEFGFEDVANPADDANGLPNNSLEAGEDFNSNMTQETYGGDMPVSPYTTYPTNTDLYSTSVNAQSTNLSIAMSSATSPGNGGTVTVTSTLGWTAPGFIVIDNEAITFTNKTPTTFTGITRGAYGSVASNHAVSGTHPVTVGQSTTLSTSISSATNPTTGGTIGITSTAGWGSSGYMVVGTELITYSAKTATAVTVSRRGAFGSTAASHSSGASATNSAKPQKNRVWYFRRALRLINGAAPNLPAPGFTVASENPVYIQGDYNVSGSSFTNGTHSYAAVIADAVTLLSNSWDDFQSFDFPYDVNNRPASTTWYRTAVAAGKGRYFTPLTYGSGQDVGTDGGVHNFLRYIENWGNGSTLNYLGSLVSLYYSRQAVGIYKCCTVVYNAPIRAYTFDVEFLVPSQLPPGTPRFRDINNLSFREMIRSEQ